MINLLAKFHLLKQSVNDEDVIDRRLMQDFTLMDVNDSDDEYDYDPDELDSESDFDEVTFWNVIDIGSRKYGVPVDSQYQQKDFSNPS